MQYCKSECKNAWYAAIRWARTGVERGRLIEWLTVLYALVLQPTARRRVAALACRCRGARHSGRGERPLRTASRSLARKHAITARVRPFSAKWRNTP